MSGMVPDGGADCPATTNGDLETELAQVTAQWAEDRVSASTLDLFLCPLPVPCSGQTNGASKLCTLSLSGFRKPEVLEGGHVGKDI